MRKVAQADDERAPLGDRRNLAFSGTQVTYGRGVGVVVATGMQTELGRIAQLLEERIDVKTPLQKRLAHFGRYLALVALGICGIIFAVGVARGEPLIRMFLTSVSLAVAAIPEALPAVVTISLALGARRMFKAHTLVRRLPAVETHISYVLFDRGAVYKIKKAVRLPFLDFTSLAARRRFCDEELRLNRRLAPELYLAVMPVTGTDAAPRVGDNGPVLDYVVQMRQFDQSALLDRALKRHAVTAPLVASLARDVERFHANAIARKSPAQDTQRVLASALENFDELQALLVDGETRAALDDLRLWTLDTLNAHTAAFEARDVRGFIRECHGDLHLGNIVLWEGRAIAFDCIEFNDRFRYVDVANDAAFLAMDLDFNGRPDLARHFAERRLKEAYAIEAKTTYCFFRACLHGGEHFDGQCAVLSCQTLAAGGGICRGRLGRHSRAHRATQATNEPRSIAHHRESSGRRRNRGRGNGGKSRAGWLHATHDGR